MKPYFFGNSQEPLFGVYHPARGSRSAPVGIVICQPFGSEYLRAHRCLRELAQRLAEAGLPVLRFDYYACGDSGGASEDGSVERWLDDIAAAILELSEATGAGRISLVGQRLGGTLASLAASRGRDIDRLVLWDPVVSGERYLAELADRHRAFFEGRPRPLDLGESDPPSELLGFPMTPALRESIRVLDLLRLAQRPARKTLLISSQAGEIDLLRDHLSRLGPAPDHERVPGGRVWTWEAELNQAVVPQSVLQRIAAWFAETAA